MKKEKQTQVEFGPEVPGYAQLNEAMRSSSKPASKPLKNRKTVPAPKSQGDKPD